MQHSTQKKHADVTIVIPAAGMGERLGLGPKALLELNGKPLLFWVTQKALRITDQVIVSAPKNQLELFKTLCPNCLILEGGSTRQESVKILVNACKSSYVLIHDAARPFASKELFLRVIDSAKETGAAGAFLQPDIPVAVIEDNIVVRDFQRNQVGIFQAPQAFKREQLVAAINMAATHNWQEQSTLQLMLRAQYTVGAVQGEKNNIKLTTPEDWQIAQFLMEYL
jgi:2-C-methyl-D-erythritol 4-phosphate cytidylyltransferase